MRYIDFIGRHQRFWIYRVKNLLLLRHPYKSKPPLRRKKNVKQKRKNRIEEDKADVKSSEHFCSVLFFVFKVVNGWVK